MIASVGFLSNAAAAQTLSQPAQSSNAAVVRNFPNVGRTATPKEVAAWDIDVRTDFKGLPKGAGSVAQGEKVWEAQCASCHGVFGESNEVFTPIVGGTTAKDIAAGRVAALLPGANSPQRTTMMKMSSLSAMWDYINRAMPWTAPKSLSADEVFAVTAYILNLAAVVPDDFTLSDRNIREVQAKLPNRNGMSTDHAMWPGRVNNGFMKTAQTKPDVQGSACMSDCAVSGALSSYLPSHARNAHGNLAEQLRPLGPARGADTTAAAKDNFALEPAGSAKFPGGSAGNAALPLSAIGAVAAGNTGAPASGAAQRSAAAAAPQTQAAMSPPAISTPAITTQPKSAGAAPPDTLKDLQPLLSKYACLACHAVDSKLLGPSFKAAGDKHRSRSDAEAYLARKIKAGGVGVWGQIPMPAQALSEPDAARIARWLVQGAPK